jgi:hypothetical protein
MSHAAAAAVAAAGWRTALTSNCHATRSRAALQRQYLQRLMLLHAHGGSQCWLSRTALKRCAALHNGMSGEAVVATWQAAISCHQLVYVGG